MDNKLDTKLDALDAQIALMREKVEQLKAEAIKLAQAAGCEKALTIVHKKSAVSDDSASEQINPYEKKKAQN